MSTPFAVTKILCPTDFSPASGAALAAAEVFATRFGARLELLHVWAPQVTVLMDAAIVPTPEQVASYVTQLEQALESEAKKVSLPGDRVARHLAQGTSPWRDIVDFASAGGYDLIVMSTHGRTGLSHMMMGSVAERVVRGSKVPVVVVPAPRS